MRCGIELGTTYSSIAWYDEVNRRVHPIDLNCADGERRLRSAVYFPGGGKPPVVGKCALNVQRLFPDRVAVGTRTTMGSTIHRFGPVDGKEYTHQEVLAEILKKLIEEATLFVGEELTDMVLGLPSYSDDAQTNAIMEAGVMALLKKARDRITTDEFDSAAKHISLLEEPQATTLGYFIQNAKDIDDEYILVYDLQEDRLDVGLVHATSVSAAGKTSVRLETLSASSNQRLGDAKWVEAMAQLVERKLVEQGHPNPRRDPRDEAILLENAERGKRTLCFMSPVFVLGDQALHQAEVSLPEFEDATHALTVETKYFLLRDLNQKLSRGIPLAKIDVLLSGGAAGMPICVQAIKDTIGKAPLTCENQTNLVSTGAAYWAHLLRSEGATTYRLGKIPEPVAPVQGAEIPATVMQKPKIFISAKSDDYDYARQISAFLRSCGVVVFQSDESLPELGSADYRKEIDRALDDAVHMVVVTSSRENVESAWVEAEWGFFVNEKRSGRKKGNLITLTVGALLPKDLPPSLRYYEVLPFRPESLERLMRYLKVP